MDGLSEHEREELAKKLAELKASRRYGKPGFGQKPGPKLIKKLEYRLKGETDAPPPKKPIQSDSGAFSKWLTKQRKRS